MGFWNDEKDIDHNEEMQIIEKEEVKPIEVKPKKNESVSDMIKRNAKVEDIKKIYPNIKLSWGGNPAKITGYKLNNKFYKIVY